MVRFVLWVPDGHVLEHSVIYYEDAIRTRPDLSTIPPRDPCLPTLQPHITPWEEVHAHVL